MVIYINNKKIYILLNIYFNILQNIPIIVKVAYLLIKWIKCQVDVLVGWYLPIGFLTGVEWSFCSSQWPRSVCVCVCVCTRLSCVCRLAAAGSGSSKSASVRPSDPRFLPQCKQKLMQCAAPPYLKLISGSPCALQWRRWRKRGRSFELSVWYRSVLIGWGWPSQRSLKLPLTSKAKTKAHPWSVSTSSVLHLTGSHCK